ncbi:MAG TPA: FliM/FliN family flagellar motor switch protein [Verrucomicrobiae bacterium]|nr:FliM/FliN family flagellar motor switch protein [Verrucomicrobiae bacterium]
MKKDLNRIQAGEAPDSAPEGAALVAKDISLVGHVPVTLTALVGSVSITVERLFALRKGEVLEMNESVDEPVTLLLNGKAIARGELVAVDDKLGIRITELA